MDLMGKRMYRKSYTTTKFKQNKKYVVIGMNLLL
jgi:hypothetical protein